MSETNLSTPKSELTSARMFDRLSDAELAYWIDNNATAMEGQPGQNNHVAAVRAAAERLLILHSIPGQEAQRKINRMHAEIDEIAHKGSS